jgi:hypothetical protein
MNANEMLHKVKTLLGVDTDNIEVNLEEVALEQLSLENGTILEADSFTSGEEVFIVTDDEKVALPVGEYELSDNRILIVKTEGMIDEIKNSEEVVEEVEAAEHEDKKEEAKEHYATKEEMTALAEAVEEVKNQLREVVEKMMEDKEKKEEMAKQETLSKPAVDGIKHTPEVEDTKLGARFAVNSNQNTTYNRVLQAITNNK